jgi:hypothetical protein
MGSGSKGVAIADLGDAHRHFSELVHVIPKADVALTIEGEWGAKDLAAHISSWDELLYLDLHRVARAHMPTLEAFQPENIDELNRVLMRGRRAFPLRQVLFEFDHCFEQLGAVIETLAEFLFEDNQMVERLVRAQITHYWHHASSLKILMNAPVKH